MSEFIDKNKDENNNAYKNFLESGAYIAFDFSKLLSENQLAVIPKNTVMSTISDLLKKIEDMNAYAKKFFDLDFASDLNYNSPDGLQFIKLRDSLGAILNYYNIKYIPGFEMLFRGQSYMPDLLLVDILKNHKKIITLDINFDFSGHYYRIFLENR